MQNQTLILSRSDHARLSQLLASDFAQVVLTSDQRQSWQRRLGAAIVADAESAATVRMHSTVQCADLQSGEREVFTLVYPEDACIEERRLCVLTYLGMSLLGARVGDIISCPSTANRRLRVQRILAMSPSPAGKRSLPVPAPGATTTTCAASGTPVRPG